MIGNSLIFNRSNCAIDKQSETMREKEKKKNSKPSHQILLKAAICTYTRIQNSS